MSDTKLKLKDLGTIHLMALDSTSLFLPFGRPISDYLRGEAGNQNGSRVFSNRGAIDFSPAVRWEESIACLLQTTGFGDLKREGLVESETEPAPAPAPDPAMAGFLPLEGPRIATPEPNLATTSPALPHSESPVSLPRVLALPLRQRMTFGAAPQKAKPPAPAAAPKPAALAPPPKPASGPTIVTPPKQTPAAPAKPVAAAPPPKVSAPAPAQTKPAAPIPPAPKSGPTAAPATRITVLQPQAPAAPKTAPSPKTNVPAAPAARAPESSPAPSKQSPAPARIPVSPAARANENVVASRDSAALAKPTPVPPPAAKAPIPVTSSRPLAPPFPPERGSSTSSGLMEQAAAHEVISRETPKAKEPESRPRPKGSLSITDSASPPAVETAAPATFEPKLGGGDSAGLFERIPMVLKIGVVLSVVAGGLYFGLIKTNDKPVANKPVFVGEQGWSTEWASDVVGSRRARQLTMYRPSAGLSDYQFQFAGQIESKAIGWIFRVADTKNYYAMKIETLRPGTMGLTHFAVVDGRESSYSQKPLTLDARPGAIYNVKLDVTGPRFTVSIQGEPVDFWTDNRLKAGSVGLMNERDERGVASAVQFSFTQVAK